MKPRLAAKQEPVEKTLASTISREQNNFVAKLYAGFLMQDNERRTSTIVQQRPSQELLASRVLNRINEGLVPFSRGLPHRWIR